MTFSRFTTSTRARATGAYLKLAEKLCKVGVLLMDDFAMATLNENELARFHRQLELFYQNT